MPFEWAIRSAILILAGVLLLKLFRVKDASLALAAWTAILIASLSIPVFTVLMRVPAPVHVPRLMVGDDAALAITPDRAFYADPLLNFIRQAGKDAPYDPLETGVPRNYKYDGLRDGWKPSPQTRFSDGPIGVDDGVARTLETVVAAVTP